MCVVQNCSTSEVCFTSPARLSALTEGLDVACSRSSACRATRRKYRCCARNLRSASRSSRTFPTIVGISDLLRFGHGSGVNRSSDGQFVCQDVDVRADRLVSALLILQAKGRITAAELAAELEISERTARRDLEALQMA